MFASTLFCAVGVLARKHQCPRCRQDKQAGEKAVFVAALSLNTLEARAQERRRTKLSFHHALTQLQSIFCIIPLRYNKDFFFDFLLLDFGSATEERTKAGRLRWSNIHRSSLLSLQYSPVTVLLAVLLTLDVFQYIPYETLHYIFYVSF